MTTLITLYLNNQRRYQSFIYTSVFVSYLVYMNTVDPDDLYPAGGCFASPRGRDREDPHQCCLWLSWVPHRGGQTPDGGNPKLSYSGPGETICSNLILLYCIMHSMYYWINIGLKIAIQGDLNLYSYSCVYR